MISPTFPLVGNHYFSLGCMLNVTYDFSSRKDDGKAERRDDDARGEEDGQLFAGVAGRVCVVDDPPGDAVRDRREDVEEEEEQRPVFAADTEEMQENPQSSR